MRFLNWNMRAGYSGCLILVGALAAMPAACTSDGRGGQDSSENRPADKDEDDPDDPEMKEDPIDPKMLSGEGGAGGSSPVDAYPFSLLPDDFSYISAIADGDDFLVFGIRVDATLTNQPRVLYRYVPSSDEWIELGGPTEVGGWPSDTFLFRGSNGSVVAIDDESGLRTRAHVYDAEDDTWETFLSPDGYLTDAVAQLNDGRIFCVLTGKAMVFDPALKVWQELADPSSQSVRGAAAVLSDGSVLNFRSSELMAERYFPETNTWEAAGEFPVEWRSPTLFALPEGRAILLGGITGDGDEAAAEKQTQIYDSTTNEWTPGPVFENAYTSPALFFLPDGLAVAGGAKFPCDSGSCGGAEVSLLDLETNEVAALPSFGWGSREPIFLPFGEEWFVMGSGAYAIYSTTGGGRKP